MGDGSTRWRCRRLASASRRRQRRRRRPCCSGGGGGSDAAGRRAPRLSFVAAAAQCAAGRLRAAAAPAAAGVRAYVLAVRHAADRPRPLFLSGLRVGAAGERRHAILSSVRHVRKEGRRAQLSQPHCCARRLSGQLRLCLSHRCCNRDTATVLRAHHQPFWRTPCRRTHVCQEQRSRQFSVLLLHPAGTRPGSTRKSPRLSRPTRGCTAALLLLTQRRSLPLPCFPPQGRAPVRPGNPPPRADLQGAAAPPAPRQVQHRLADRAGICAPAGEGALTGVLCCAVLCCGFTHQEESGVPWYPTDREEAGAHCSTRRTVSPAWLCAGSQRKCCSTGPSQPFPARLRRQPGSAASWLLSAQSLSRVALSPLPQVPMIASFLSLCAGSSDQPGV